MPTGLMAAASLAAAQNTTILTVPVAKIATVTVSLCNTTSSPVTVRIALSNTESPSDGAYIEFNTTIGVGSAGVLERGGIVLSSGQKLIAYSDISGVNYSVWGFEE